MTRPPTRTTSASRQSFKNCRVVDIGVRNFGECLKEGPSTCCYAVPFGYCFLCGHPRVNEIIENTKKVQAFAGAAR
jgi:hypothetical protein